jgi:hypothetical protein
MVVPDSGGLEGDGGDQAQSALAIREGSYAANAPFDLAAEPLEAVGGTDPNPVLLVLV